MLGEHSKHIGVQTQWIKTKVYSTCGGLLCTNRANTCEVLSGHHSQKTTHPCDLASLTRGWIKVNFDSALANTINCRDFLNKKAKVVI